MPKKQTKKTRVTLAMLVDDYLEKHEEAITAGIAWRNRKCHCDGARDPLLDKFTNAHNARALAFRALRDRRRPPKPDMWAGLVK